MLRFKRSFLLGLVVAGYGCGGGDAEIDSEVATEIRSNRDPDRLVVYSVNIENMIFDWKDLIYAMEEEPLRPDIFLVQQVTDRREMNRLVEFMERRLGGAYRGVVAQAEPDDRRFQGQVRPRPTVTTGIVFRSGRFDLVAKDSWMPFGKGFKNQRQTCDERSSHSGYETLRVRLRDRVRGVDVIVVSLRHWTWHPCSSKNVLEIVRGKRGGGNGHAGLGSGALHIVAGDFNDDLFDAGGGYKCWYRYMNGGLGRGRCDSDLDLGFTDPMFEACDGARRCVDRNNGIDHIFVRRGDGSPARTSRYHEISFAEAERASRVITGGDGRSNVRSRDGYDDAGSNYSQHRARRAYVFYD
jgi:hypothetical protein